MGPTWGTTVAWTAARTSAARNRCFIGLIIIYCSSIKEYKGESSFTSSVCLMGSHSRIFAGC
jgi:hypothetical protein